MANEKYWSCPNNEQETTISFGRTDDLADIWTNDKTMMTKFDKLCETAPELYKCIDVGRTRDKEIMCKRYKIDKGMLSFRSKKMQRELTDEQRAVLAERGRQNRARQLETLKTASVFCSGSPVAQNPIDES